MLDLAVTNLTSQRVYRGRVLAACRRILGELGRRATKIHSLSVVVVTTPRMKQLNWQYRKKRRSTDVLSFALPADPSQSSGIDGEIILCWDEAQRLAKKQRQSVTNALIYLLIHGILHLAGFNHEGVSRKQAQRMMSRQDVIAKQLHVEFE